jgi:hypothetical protein
VLRPGELTKEVPKHQLEAVPRILRRQVWNERLPPDKDFYFRDQVDNKLAVRADLLCESRALPAPLLLALYQDLTDQSLNACARVA